MAFCTSAGDKVEGTVPCKRERPKMSIRASPKPRAPGNRTIVLTPDEQQAFAAECIHLTQPVPLSTLLDSTLCQDLLEAVPFLPSEFVDLLFVDPPYNLDKSFNGRPFRMMETESYIQWLDSWLSQLTRLLKKSASVYICSDWRSTSAVQFVAERYFKVRNRITWEREKGRGAKTNWKNCLEDVLFCTVTDDYTFNVDAVKLKKRVIAPYTHHNGQPKDWARTNNGNFRLTHPSNLWTDLTVPFWSMPENTDHPAQKPEKLLAKIVLASSNPGDVVLDPFLGSGTTSVVAKKLGRRFIGIELDPTYCSLAQKRLLLAESGCSIQGYQDGVFWERNTLSQRTRNCHQERLPETPECTLFPE